MKVPAITHQLTGAYIPFKTLTVPKVLSPGAKNRVETIAPDDTTETPLKGNGTGPSSNSSSSVELALEVMLVCMGSAIVPGSGSTYGQLVGSAHCEQMPDFAS